MSSKTAEYAFFSSVHAGFSKIDHMLGHKINLSKFQIKIIPSIISDHSCIKLEINYIKKTGRNTNTCRLNNMLLNSQWVNGEIREENKKHLETSENGNTLIQNVRDAVKPILRRKFRMIQAYLKK